MNTLKKLSIKEEMLEIINKEKIQENKNKEKIDSKLVHLISNGMLEEIKEYIKTMNHDVDLFVYNKWYILGKPDMLEFFIEKGGSEDAMKRITDTGDSLLGRAIKCSVNNAIFLIEKFNADVEYINIANESILEIAIESSSFDLVKLIIERHTDIEKIIKNNGFEYLKKTIKKDSFVLFKLLVENGADINNTNKIGETLLDYQYTTFNNGEQSLKIFKYLVSNCENIALKTTKEKLNILMEATYKKYTVEKIKIILKLNKIDVNEKDFNGRNAILYAVTPYTSPNYRLGSTNFEIIKLLIDYGADINCQDKDGNNIFEYILEFEEYNHSLMKEIITKTNIDIRKENYAGDALIHKVIKLRSYGMVEFLLERGIDINTIHSRTGNSLVYLSLQYQSSGILKLLLEHGADPVISRENGKTPLEFIFGESDDRYNKEMISLLIKFTKDFSTLYVTKRGLNLLHESVRRNYRSVAKRLIEKGADINSQDKDGRTALMIASINKNNNIIKLLIDKGANTDITDYNGKTALDYLRK